jgi:8-oxo-dGTP pyrophosphatase MutT (NUDIX family)
MTAFSKEGRAALRAALAGRPRDALDLEGEGFRRAGVLVSLFVRPDDEGLRSVVTLRPPEMRAHAGQWAFPGGRVDASDRDVISAAVREAEEEIGIDPATVEPLGLLGDVPVPSFHTITPVVAWLDPAPVAYRPNPTEVAEVFEFPLARLRVPGVLEIGDQIERWGRVYTFLKFRVDGREIWGATARILSELLGVVG